VTVVVDDRQALGVLVVEARRHLGLQQEVIVNERLMDVPPLPHAKMRPPGAT